MTESLREKIYQAVRDDITYGRLSSGERLVESMLVERFRASRSPIREALRQLVSEGLITFERNKGITVSKLSTREVDEIYTLRWLLESYAARLTAGKATKKDLKYLNDLSKKLRAAAKENDLMSWLENNTLFHDFLVHNSGNKNLERTLDTLKRRVYHYKYIIIRIPGHFEEYIQQHEGILEGCETNDGAMAEKYMKVHLQKIKEVLIDYLSKYPGI